MESEKQKRKKLNNNKKKNNIVRIQLKVITEEDTCY